MILIPNLSIKSSIIILVLTEITVARDQPTYEGRHKDETEAQNNGPS